MGELVRSNEYGLVNVIEGLLTAEGIPYQVADRHISTIEGSISAFRMRILVPDEYDEQARQLLVDADLGHWLKD